MSALIPLSPNPPSPRNPPASSHLGAHTRPRRAAGSLALLAVAALAALPAAAVSTACKPAVRVDNPSPFDEDDPAAQPGAATHIDSAAGSGADSAANSGAGSAAGVPRAAAGAPRATTRARRSPGLRIMTVARADLHAALDRGPGAFLRGVEVKPHFRGDRFGGWEIVQFMPGEARFDPFDLRPGDVIGPVNGHVIARPQHLATLWSELRSAETIVIQVQRGQGAFELRFDVSDEAKPATP